MTDARVQALAENYQGLESVNLVCCSEVTDAGVQALAEHCPSLKSVHLWWCASTLQQYSLSFWCEFSLGRLRRLGALRREFAAKMRDSVHRALRGATRWCATL